MMKKRNILITFILFSMFAGVGCSNGNSSSKINKEFTKDEVKEINIENKSLELNFKKSSDNKIHVEIESLKEDVDKKVKVEANGEVLSINQNSEDKSFTDEFTIKKEGSISVYLPEHVNEKVSMKNHSGDIRINDVTIENLSIENKSGEVKIEKGSIQNIDIESNSGDLYLNDLVGGENSINTESGEVNLKSINEEASINVQTNSGDINAIYNNKPQSLTISTYSDSKEIEIKLDNITLNENKANKKCGVIGGGTNRLNLISKSGSISVR